MEYVQIKLKIKSTSDWSSIDKAKGFADILLLHKDFLLPEKFDRQEPERFAYDPNDLSKFIEQWTSEIVGFHANRKKPYPAFISFDIWRKEHRQFNGILACFDVSYFRTKKEIESLLESVKQIYNWGHLDHGYIYHSEDWEKKNKFFSEEVYEVIGRLPRYGGNRPEEGLPGVYWANYFGPIYVDFFGKEKFLTVPAFHKEELPDGGFLLLTSESPFDYQKKEVQKLQENIIDHLGRDAFFERRNPKIKCATPYFEFKQKALGRPLKVDAYDEIQFVIPRPEKFIHDMPQLLSSLQKRIKQKLDYTFSSLQIIDKYISKMSKQTPEPWKDENSCQIVQELTAYYGEVFRVYVGGEWDIRKGSERNLHPVIVFEINNKEFIEYPFARVNKYWSEQDRSDALLNKFHVAIRGF